MKIRRATIADLPEVYELLDALRGESVWGQIPIEPNEPYVHSQLMITLYNPHQLLLVAEFESDFPVLNGELIGVCGAEVVSHWLLPGLTYIQEWALYVKPRCRSMEIGKALWKEAVKWGKDQGAYGSVYGKIAIQRPGYVVEEMIWHVFREESRCVGMD